MDDTVFTGGCAIYSSTRYYTSKFQINEIVWLKSKALKGKVEKIAIKSIKMPFPYNFLYKDHLNSLYNEKDLLKENEAIDLIEQFVEKMNFLNRQNVKNC